MKRVVILVNKDFEYAGFIEGLRSVTPVYAGTNGRQAECRFSRTLVDIYCIQNLFKPEENSSNSEIKYGYLRDLFATNAFRIDEIDEVLSVSTSESTPISEAENGSESRNGSVFVGNSFFLSDQGKHDKTTQSHLAIGTEEDGHTEYYVSKSKCSYLYDIINGMVAQFKPAPNNSAVEPHCIGNYDFLSVGVANVMDYSCYNTADEDAYLLAQKKVDKRKAVCIETTHGVVVKALKDAYAEAGLKQEPRVTFISPIVDRYLQFDNDVDGKYGKQNFICSYNGGVATGKILDILNTYFMIRK